MGLKGSLVKGAISLIEPFFTNKSIKEKQQETLKNLIIQAQHTSFGKRYKFDELIHYKNLGLAFSRNIPVFNYNSLYHNWLYRTIKGEPDVLWPGNPKYFALSSGTTGSESKRIPVTADMLESFKSAGVQQLMGLNNFNLSTEFFEKDVLMLGSSSDLKTNKLGFKEGEISGITTSNLPEWFNNYYKPGNEISSENDWDRKIELIANKASQWDVGMISGIPSWIELMLKKVIEVNNLSNIHDIWPNLEVYTSGGVPFDTYEESFKNLFGKKVNIIDTYLASEGYIATQVRPDSDDRSMQLNYDADIYFEFIPFREDYFDENGLPNKRAKVVNLSRVALNQEYVLLISTPAGLWRYMIGDVVKFTNIERAEIKITGRTKFFLNKVGSQLSQKKMDEAILELSQKLKTEIKEYTVSALKADEDYKHVWHIGVRDENIDENDLAKELDLILKSKNKNYKVARSKALKEIEVKAINPDLFIQWQERRKQKGGQMKMEKVMNDTTYKKWKNFITG